MRILVVGGTRFVGRQLVTEAVRHGHDVTVVHRGVGCPGDPDTRHVHADRDGDLSVLSGSWDATVDTCAYRPVQVAALADALGDRGGRHLLISTVSVYADAARPGLDEHAALQPPMGIEEVTHRAGRDPDPGATAVTPASYGSLKVGCELVARQRHDDRLVIVRPTYVVGPWDYTGRFPYWVERFAGGGRILVPGPPGAPFQYVDARDLAAFCLSLLERGGQAGQGVPAVFHAMAPPPFTWADLVAALVTAVAPPDTEPIWVGSRWLVEHGVTGPELPLWTGSDEPEHVLAMDPARALAAGLQVRPLADSARDTLEWLREPTTGSALGVVGLSEGRERALLASWRETGH